MLSSTIMPLRGSRCCSARGALLASRSRSARSSTHTRAVRSGGPQPSSESTAPPGFVHECRSARGGAPRHRVRGETTTTTGSGGSRKAEGPLARTSGHQKSGGVWRGKFVLKVLALRLPSQSDQHIVEHRRARTGKAQIPPSSGVVKWRDSGDEKAGKTASRRAATAGEDATRQMTGGKRRRTTCNRLGRRLRSCRL